VTRPKIYHTPTFREYFKIMAARGTVDGRGAMLQAGSSSQAKVLEFLLINLILPAAPWSWGLLSP
jgi:hypothetical protein